MPRYEPNQANANATREIYDKDEYEFIIGEPKPFFNAGKEQENGEKKGDNYGIAYVLTFADGKYAGKKYFKNLFLHSQGAEDMAKQFMLAAHGFASTRDGEEEFNNKIMTMDQSYNTDTSEAGDYWTSIKGGRIKGTLTQKVYNGNLQNQDGNWSPL